MSHFLYRGISFRKTKILEAHGSKPYIYFRYPYQLHIKYAKPETAGHVQFGQVWLPVTDSYTWYKFKHVFKQELEHDLLVFRQIIEENKRKNDLLKFAKNEQNLIIKK